MNQAYHESYQPCCGSTTGDASFTLAGRTSLVRREHFGITSVETPDLPLAGGGTLTLTFD